MPWICRSRAPRALAPGRLSISPRVYGWRGWSSTSATVPCSTMRPAYITAISSARPATTDRSWLIQISEVPVSRTSFCTSDRICAWIVTSSAVVGSSAMIRSGPCSIAMAIATRWRMPPESWCG